MKTALNAFMVGISLMQISILVFRFVGYIPTSSPTMWVVAWGNTIVTIACTALVFYVNREPKENPYKKFCWWPTEISVYVPNVCRGGTGQWRKTGRKIWLKRVRVLRTVWGETFYTYPG